MRKLQCMVIIPLAIFAMTLLFTENAQAQTQEISGTWKMNVETSGGSGNPVFVLKQEQDTLISGTYSGLFGEANVNGTLKGNKIDINFSASGYPMKYIGTVEGDSIKGIVKFANMGEGTFTGKKQEE